MCEQDGGKHSGECTGVHHRNTHLSVRTMAIPTSTRHGLTAGDHISPRPAASCVANKRKHQPHAHAHLAVMCTASATHVRKLTHTHAPVERDSLCPPRQYVQPVDLQSGVVEQDQTRITTDRGTARWTQRHTHTHTTRATQPLRTSACRLARCNDSNHSNRRKRKRFHGPATAAEQCDVSRDKTEVASSMTPDLCANELRHCGPPLLHRMRLK